MKLNDFKLNVLTIDRPDKSHLQQVQELLDAGAKWIQYRNKSQTFSEYKSELIEIVQLCKSSECTLIVNDSLDGLQAAKADGVHLGKNDLNPQVVRNIIGTKKLIGATVNSVEDAQKVMAFHSKGQQVINYVGLGPFQPTTTKENLAEIMTEDVIKECVQILGDIPVVLIGGIDLSNISQALQLPIQGVAVSSAICSQDNIAQSYTEVNSLIQESSL